MSLDLTSEVGIDSLKLGPEVSNVGLDSLKLVPEVSNVGLDRLKLVPEVVSEQPDLRRDRALKLANPRGYLFIAHFT
jgi:hypothetical protein